MTTMKLPIALLLALSLFFPQSVGAYSNASNVRIIEDDTATNTTTTPTKDDLILNNIGSTDSDVDGLTDGSEPEPDTANPDLFNPDFLNPAASDDEPETTGIEHEDIGITGGDGGDAENIGVPDPEDEPSEYNESDFDFVNRLIELGAVFLKFDGVKGESGVDGNPDQPLVTGQVYNVTGTSSGTKPSGNVEYSWKVEEGEASKKPKEIVVVGSKVRGWDAKTKEEIIGAVKDPSDVDTLGESIASAAKALDENSHFNEIRMDDSSASVDYEHGLRLFGFWRTTMRSEVAVVFGEDEHGRVKVQFPWWHVFGRKTVRPADITSAYDEAANSYDNFGRIVAAQEINKRNAIALQILGGILDNAHDPGVTLLES